MSNTKNPILQGISNWFVRHFSDPEALALFFHFVLCIFIN